MLYSRPVLINHKSEHKCIHAGTHAHTKWHTETHRNIQTKIHAPRQHVRTNTLNTAKTEFPMRERAICMHRNSPAQTIYGHTHAHTPDTVKNWIPDVRELREFCTQNIGRCFKTVFLEPRAHLEGTGCQSLKPRRFQSVTKTSHPARTELSDIAMQRGSLINLSQASRRQ